VVHVHETIKKGGRRAGVHGEVDRGRGSKERCSQAPTAEKREGGRREMKQEKGLDLGDPGRKRGNRALALWSEGKGRIDQRL